MSKYAISIMGAVNSVLKALLKQSRILYPLRKYSSNIARPPSLELPSGQKMPQFGIGTWQLTSENEINTTINTALTVGYRHIDTAIMYDNEEFIGNVLQQWISSNKLSRDDLFITTKLPKIGVHPDRVEMFLTRSLKNLQLDYVDLYLIHFPVGFKYIPNMNGRYATDLKGRVVMEEKTDHAAIWRKMEEQVEANRTKNIGLSNYNIPQMTTVLESARIKPANLQVEIHIFFNQDHLVDFCKKNGITVTAYSPLANPGYNKFMKKLEKPATHLPKIFLNTQVIELGKKYSKTPAQIALRFLLQRGLATIPKSATPKRIEENINVFDFVLTDDEMKMLHKLEMGDLARVVDFTVYQGIYHHPDFPF